VTEAGKYSWGIVGIIIVLVVVVGFRVFGITTATLWNFNFFDLMALVMFGFTFGWDIWMNDLRLNSPKLMGVGISTTTDMNRIRRVGRWWVVPGNCIVAKGFNFPIKDKNIDTWIVVPYDHLVQMRGQGCVITCDVVRAPSMYHMPADARRHLVALLGRLNDGAENNYGRGWRHKLEILVAWPTNIESLEDRLMVTEYLDAAGNLVSAGGEGWDEAEFSTTYRDPMYDYYTKCPHCDEAWDEVDRLQTDNNAYRDALDNRLDHMLNQVVGMRQVVYGAGEAAGKARWWESIRKKDEA